jgi:glycolate oxidase
VISTARLNRIVRVDAVCAHGGRPAGRAQPRHFRSGRAQSACTTRPIPSSQIACTIGGNVAENSGGVHCLKYGLTVHNVLRVRVCTIEGEIVELGGEALDAPGLDLLAVFIGSEGMLGIVTEVTVKLVPKPAQAQVIMASFDDVVTGGNAVASVIAAGIIPAGLEMMDRTSSRMVEPFVKAGYDLDAAAILLCEADGTALEVAEEIERMTAVLQQAGATRSRYRRTRPSACASGPAARTPSRPPAASRPTTTAWTAPSRASTWPRC